MQPLCYTFFSNFWNFRIYIFFKCACSFLFILFKGYWYLLYSLIVNFVCWWEIKDKNKLICHRQNSNKTMINKNEHSLKLLNCVKIKAGESQHQHFFPHKLDQNLGHIVNIITCAILRSLLSSAVNVCSPLWHALSYVHGMQAAMVCM